MREPVAWQPVLPRLPVDRVVAALRNAVTGCHDTSWPMPAWLRPHQQVAAQRLAGALRAFGGALLADAVGLGKSYVALALATRYPRTVIVMPAAIREQWRRLTGRLGIAVEIVSHEAASRGTPLPHSDLVVIDEAHRFRNPHTRRYDRVCRTLRNAHVLLLTATPVVNHARDLVHLLRLFLSDHTLAPLGVPSLHAAAERRRDDLLLQAVAPLTVSRTTETAGIGLAMPHVRGMRVLAFPAVADETLVRVIAAFDECRFPSFGSDAAHLLRLHLLYRLASSRAACLETVRRHEAYLRRAVAAAERGERLPRAAARRLLLDDVDGQLELALTPVVAERIAVGEFRDERQRLRRAHDLLLEADVTPKTAALTRLLRKDRGRKTIVFTASSATALELGQALAWRRLAVTTSRGARIASGKISVDHALDLFAPRARRCLPPAAGLELDLLVTTDLASEGLDLQDASRIVHYDLPWTPFRLEQRLGRLVRLGSHHRHVQVFWFAPPARIDRRLGLRARIRTKTARQLRSVVPATTGVGAVRLENRVVSARERWTALDDAATAGYAVVNAPAVAAVALRWHVGRHPVRQVVSIPSGDPLDTLRRLSSAPTSHADLPRWCIATVGRLVGRRIRLADRGPLHPAGRQLILDVLRRAHAAGRLRNVRLIAALDGVLRLVQLGLTEGDERTLREALAGHRPEVLLRAWLGRPRNLAPTWHGPEVEALLVGAKPADSTLP